MRIAVALYAFVLAEPLDGVLNHLLNLTPAFIYLFLHSGIPEVEWVCDKWARHERVQYFPYRVNRGLSLSVNDALIQAYEHDGMDVLITCNDDVSLRPWDIVRLAETALTSPNAYMVEAWGNTGGREEGVNTACAAITKRAMETIGYFDEGFWPAYYEDCDYNYRGQLAGLEKVTARNTYVRHVGSASLRYVPQPEHDLQFLANQGRYCAKWGGDKGRECFTHPFNRPE